MQTSSASSTQSARSAAPAREAGPQGAAASGAGGKPGDLFSELMSQAGAERKALQAMQEQADQRAAQEVKAASKAAAQTAAQSAARPEAGRTKKAKEPSPDDVANSLVPQQAQGAPAAPAEGAATATGPLSAGKRLSGTQTAADGSPAAPGRAGAETGEADGAGPGGPLLAADGGGDGASDATADRIGFDATNVDASAATGGSDDQTAARGGVKPDLPAQAAQAARAAQAAQASQEARAGQEARADQAGNHTLRADASVAAAAARLAAGAGDGADAGSASRLRRTGREAVAVGERAGVDRGPGARADGTTAELGSYRITAANATAEGAGTGSGAADTSGAQSAGAAMAAAAGSSSGADGGLFALTMNQTVDSAGLVANRQEMMSPAMQAAIDVPVDHEAFAEAFARQSASLVVQGNGNAEISVTPPDLGPIRIAISMEADGAWLDIAAGHAETRAAIEASIPHLRQMLADQGVRLSDWRLREESASDSRPANGGGASPQSGQPGDGTRSDSGQQRAGADAAAHQGSGYGHGEARGRGPQPADRWTPAGPPTAAPQPAVGPGAAGSNRRLDLYA